jgi:lipid A disaccharide synthetase
VPVWRRNLPVWLERLQELNVLEIENDFPRMEIQVLMPAHLAAMSREWLRKFHGGKFVQFVTIRTDKKSALADADWALAFPGTLTLELALSQVPTAILAVIDPLTLAVGSRLLRSTRLGLPNLLLEEDVFSEWVGVSAELTRVKFQKVLQDLWVWNRAWQPLQERLSRVLGTGNGAEIVAGECMRLVNASQSTVASH